MSAETIAPDAEDRARHPPGPRRARGSTGRVLRAVRLAGLAFLGLSLAAVLILRWLPPPATAFMLREATLATLEGREDYRLRHDWVAWEAMADSVKIAVVAAEDQRFPEHAGFDLAAIRQALERNRDGGRVYGASTLSQQVAKNLFLWPERSWLRKMFEAWFTTLIELCWDKRRILEVYLNVAQFGEGVWGVEAAAQIYFRRPAASLSASQAALLAAVLPNPVRYRVEAPSDYVRRRQAWVAQQARQLGGIGYLEQL